MKVGIDLSSTNTGLVILSDDNKLVFHGNFQLWDSSDIFATAWKIEEMVDTVMFKRLLDNKVEVGIELSNFKNANITNRFNLLSGMIIANFQKKLHSMESFWINIKLFNSNEWQRFLLDIYKPDIECIKEVISYEKYDDGDSCVDKVPIYKEYYQINYRYKTPSHELNYKDIIGDREYKSMRIDKNERTLRKALSRIFAEQNCIEYHNGWTEDECDAYCIAYFLPQLRDRTQMHQEVKAKKVQTKKSKAQELRAKASKEHKISKLKDIVIKYKSMENLTKAQQRALDNAIKELKELENEN